MIKLLKVINSIKNKTILDQIIFPTELPDDEKSLLPKQTSDDISSKQPAAEKAA